MGFDTMRDAVRRSPFRAFTLRMNDGREFKVPHPEFLAVSKRVVMVIDVETGAGLQLEPLLIASMQKTDKNLAGSTSSNDKGESNTN